MNPKNIIQAVNKQRWLDPVAKTLQQAVHRAYSAGGATGQTIMNWMHGTWLGHPLHPALTDVPVGAWTAAAVLDAAEMASGRDELALGADSAVAVGLVGAVGSAVTGLTDWHRLMGEARRVGALHGLMNIGAALLYTGSLVLRLQHKRRAGQALGLMGYAITFASAYLGGDLAYELHVGVDHARKSKDSLPRDFTAVLPAADLKPDELRRVEAKGVPVLLVKRDENIYALVETCAHLGGPLAEGRLEGNSVVCPWHSSRYALDTGQVLDGPSAYWQPCLDVRVQNGQIEVRLPAR